MYMRINDVRFEPDAERELQEADVVDDPLIRCLFGDTFGAYQAAQLRRLLTRTLTGPLTRPPRSTLPGPATGHADC